MPKSEKELAKIAQKWDKSMTKAFKGIMPAPERHRFLKRAVNK